MRVSVEKLLFLTIAAGLMASLIWLPLPLGGVMMRFTESPAIARNFYELGMNPLLPRVDWTGLGSGIVEAKFLVLPWLAALIYHITGVQEWVGRLLAILFSTFTIWYVYRLGLRMGDRRFALLAAALFSILPLRIYFGAMYFSEPLLIWALIACIFHFDLWLEKTKIIDYLFAVVFLTVAVLLKPPSLVLGLPLAAMAYEKYGGKFISRLDLWAFAGIVLLVFGAWFGYAHSLYSKYGNTYWMRGWGIWFEPRMLADWDFWYRMIFKVFTSRPLTYGGVVLVLMGLFVRDAKHDRMLWAWLAGIAVYFVAVAKGNILHEHYQMPLMLPGAYLMARAVNRWVFGKVDEFSSDRVTELSSAKSSIRPLSYSVTQSPGKLDWKGWLAVFALALLVVQTFAKQVVYFRELRRDLPKIEAARAFDARLPDDAKVMVLDNYSPMMLYYVHRKGWKWKLDEMQLSALNADLDKIYLTGAPAEVEEYWQKLPEWRRGSFYHKSGEFDCRIILINRVE